MQKHQINRKPSIYFVLVIAYSWIIWAPFVLSGFGVGFKNDQLIEYTQIAVGLGAFGPLLAALTLIVRQHGWGEVWPFIRQALDFKTKPVYFGLALILPTILTAVPHYLAPVFGLEVAETLIPPDLPLPVWAVAILYFLMILFVGGGQEEFGWRGYAQQPLQERYGSVAGSLMIGVVWGLWHLPVWFMPGDNHSSYSFVAFMLLTVGQAFIYTWIYNASGQKLIIPLIFHAVNNTVPGFFPFLHTIEGKPETAYWVYSITTLIGGLVALILILKQNTQRRGE